MLTVDFPIFTLSKTKFQLYFQNQMKDKRSFKISRYYQFFIVVYINLYMVIFKITVIFQRIKDAII